MHPVFNGRVFLGVGLMLACCVTAIRFGSIPHRVTAIAVLVCWAAAAVMQIVTGSLPEPIIGADVLFSACLLWLVASYHQTWLWILSAVEILRFFLHASLYGEQVSDLQLYALLNNILSTAGLLVILVSSLRWWRLNRR